MSNTISKNFRDSQIKGVLTIDGRKVLYLKDGVKKKWYAEDVNNPSVYKLESHLNHELISYQSRKKFMEVMGFEDWDSWESITGAE